MREKAVPEPGPGQLLVAMRYAPVNPADLLAIDGRYPFPHPPGEPFGAEGVGVVERVGPGVDAFRPGDPVLPLSRGNWTRYRLLDADEAIAVPREIDPLNAAMLRINPMTALLLLEKAALGPGDWLIPNAATSSVAFWVRHFAAERGLRLINVVRRSPPEPLPNQIEDGPGLAERIPDGAVVKAALDGVAGEATGHLAAALAPGGRVIVFGHLSGAPCAVPSQLLTGRGIEIHGFSLRPAEARLGPGERARLFAQVFAAAQAVSDWPPVREVVPLSRIGDALRLARQAGPGRVMLRLDA